MPAAGRCGAPDARRPCRRPWLCFSRVSFWHAPSFAPCRHRIRYRAPQGKVPQAAYQLMGSRQRLERTLISRAPGTAAFARRFSSASTTAEKPMPKIADAKILIIATNGFEQDELLVPRDKLREAGAKVTVATPDGKTIRGWNHDDWGRDAEADAKIADTKCADYDALVIPGGVINPDKLRVDADAMKVVKDFLATGKTVAAICHGPWLLVQADACRGREMTSYKSIRKDVENAGGRWVDKEVVGDNGVVPSRSPDDLGAFVPKIIEEIEEGRHQRRQAAE